MRPPWRDTAAIAGGVALGIAAVLVARWQGFDLPWLVAVPAGLGVGVLGAIGLHLPHLDPGSLEPQVEDRTDAGTVLADLSALRFVVRAAESDPERFEQRVRPRLCAVTADLLWQRHGIDVRTSEGHEAAGNLAGPLTWAMLTAPPYALDFTPRLLAGWVDEMEQL